MITSIKQSTRTCAQCKQSFVTLSRNATTCASKECVLARRRKNSQKHNEREMMRNVWK
jgi:hypothetical protein